MIEINIEKKLHFSDGEGVLQINKSFDRNEFLVLYGSSGVGKTTLLRIIAGLDSPDNGKIIIDGITWFDNQKHIDIKPQKRSIGFVFQDYALFSNMTVKENLMYAQSTKDEALLEELMEQLSLKGIENRKPLQLSGGQKQRTAIARAILRKPQILLLDEPLSALDNDTRNDLQNKLLEIHKKFNLTTIMVSHDLAEIAKLSTKVWELDAGKIVREGYPLEIFTQGKVSGKFKLVGEIIDITKEDIIYILTVVSGNNFVKVVATREDVRTLSIGDKVMIASKAFNPIIMKI